MHSSKLSSFLPTDELFNKIFDMWQILLNFTLLSQGKNLSSIFEADIWRQNLTM